MTHGLKDRHFRAIVDVLSSHAGVEKAVLFGSRAMGTFSPESDADICIFGDSLTMTDLARLITAMEELPIAQTVDLHLHHRIKEQALIDHIC